MPESYRSSSTTQPSTNPTRRRRRRSAARRGAGASCGSTAATRRRARQEPPHWNIGSVVRRRVDGEFGPRRHELRGRARGRRCRCQTTTGRRLARGRLLAQFDGLAARELEPLRGAGLARRGGHSHGARRRRHGLLCTSLRGRPRFSRICGLGAREDRGAQAEYRRRRRGSRPGGGRRSTGARIEITAVLDGLEKTVVRVHRGGGFARTSSNVAVLGQSLAAPRRWRAVPVMRDFRIVASTIRGWTAWGPTGTRSPTRTTRGNFSSVEETRCGPAGEPITQPSCGRQLGCAQ